jgi:hypothetical protein
LILVGKAKTTHFKYPVGRIIIWKQLQLLD